MKNWVYIIVLQLIYEFKTNRYHFYFVFENSLLDKVKKDTVNFKFVL